jgi:hypothetical protein
LAAAEEAFDLVAVGVGVLVAGALFQSVGFGRNDGIGLAQGNGFGHVVRTPRNDAVARWKRVSPAWNWPSLNPAT